MAKAKERNPERQHLANILECGYVVFGQERFGVADLVDVANGNFTDLTESDEHKEARRLLGETVHEIASERGGRTINSRVLGRWLERHADAPVSGKWLARVEQHRGSAQWRIAL
jgi:hypothetical protein